MSLLLELEKLQRCLEGAADSDADETGRDESAAAEGKAAECKQSKKDDESSVAIENENETTGSWQDSASEVPSLDVDKESACKKLSVEEGKASRDTTLVTAEKLAVGSRQSAEDFDEIESAGQLSKPHISSQESDAKKGFISKSVGSELKMTSTHAITIKNVPLDSGMLPENASKDVADVETSKTEIFPASSSEKESTSKVLKQDEVKTPSSKQDKVKTHDEVTTPSSKQDIVKTHSSKQYKIKTSFSTEDASVLKQEETARFTLNESERKIPSVPEVRKDLSEAVMLSRSTNKVEKVSEISESKASAGFSPKLTVEKELILKKLKPEKAKNINNSRLGAVERSSDLQTNAKKLVPTMRQISAVVFAPMVSAKSKLQEVKMTSSAVKTPASDSGLGVGSKTKSEPSSLQPPSPVTLKDSKLGFDNTPLRKSLDRHQEHMNRSETAGKVKSTPSCPVTQVPLSRLEEVKISNGRPVIRLLKLSSDSIIKKTETEGTPRVLASLHPSILVVKRGNVSMGGRSPDIKKRKVSFEVGPTVVHVPGDKHPPVPINSSKNMESEEMKMKEAGSNIKERKLTTDVGSPSANTAFSLQTPEEKCPPMEILKTGHEKQVASGTSIPTEEVKSSDDSLKKVNISMNPESPLLDDANSRRDSGEKCAQELEVNKGVFTGASNPVAVKRIVATPLVRKRKASSDLTTLADTNASRVASESEGLPASILSPGGKRTKLSASEISISDKETIESEPTIPKAGSGQVAQSPTTKRVPITSTMELTISPQGIKQNVQAVPVIDSNIVVDGFDVQEVKGDDVAVLKEDLKKEFMEVRVVVKKLNIPVPDYLLSLPTQTKKIEKTKTQNLQRTATRVSVLLQETLTQRPRLKKRKVGRPKKLEDAIVEPIKRQNVMKRSRLQQRIMGRQTQKKMMGRLSHQKIIGKSLQHKFVGESKQQRVMRKSSQQKSVGRRKEQRTLSKPKTVQKILPTSQQHLAVRIGLKKKKIVPKKPVSSKINSKSALKSKKVVTSIVAKKTMKKISFGNPKDKRSVKSVIDLRRPEKIVGDEEKKVTLTESKKNKFHGKEKMVFPKRNTRILSKAKEEEVMSSEMRVKRPLRTYQEKKKKLQEPKKDLTVDKKTKKSQENPVEQSESNGGETAGDDEWIVEVLLDDTEIDMMTINSQGEVGHDTNISRVSSSDDGPKDLCVNTSDLDVNRSLECDSSTDTNRNRKTVGGGAKNVRKIVKTGISDSDRTSLNTKAEQRQVLPYVKQVTSSVSADEQTGISAEQKMAEMRKAIGDLERIADRSMLRLKAEERLVVHLTNKLRQYESDKHHKMLRKILRDSAPGPKQNPDAMFILDLLLSYYPEEDETSSQEMLQAPIGSSFQFENHWYAASSYVHLSSEDADHG